MSATTPDHGNGCLSTSHVDLLLTVGPPSLELEDGAQRTNMLTRCGSCSSRLAWPTPKADQWASPVACPNCGRWYFCEGRNRTKVRLVEQPLRPLDNAPGQQPLESTTELIARLLNSIGQKDERRGSVRHSIMLPLVGVPVNREGRPVCEAIQMTLSDISSGGVGLVTSRAFRSPLLILDFGPAGLKGTQLLTELRWSETAADNQLLGCRFLHHPDDGLPFVDAANPDPQ